MSSARLGRQTEREPAPSPIRIPEIRHRLNLMARIHRTLWPLTLLLVALTLGLEFAHVLEWGPKSDYSGRLYVRLQESLYVWFGYLGSVLYILAILSTLGLAISVRGHRRVRWHAASAAGLEMVALIVFFAMIYPVNLRFPVPGNGAVPTDWTALRNRWELGHTIGFVLFATSFLLLVAVLVRLDAQPGNRALPAQRPIARSLPRR